MLGFIFGCTVAYIFIGFVMAMLSHYLFNDPDIVKDIAENFSVEDLTTYVDLSEEYRENPKFVFAIMVLSLPAMLIWNCITVLFNLPSKVFKSKK